MTRLAEPEKLEIVRLLARFNSYADVVVQMREQHGVEVDRFQVRTYDPTNARYEGGEKWRTIFYAERSKYLGDIESIPIAHKAFRLGELQKSLERAQRSGNLVLANATLAQAANEMRGVSNMSSQIGVHSVCIGDDHLTPEEMRREFRDMLDKVLGRARDRDNFSQPVKAIAA